MATAAVCSALGCMKPGTHACSKCKTPYCSTACQRNDWKRHKPDCAAGFAAAAAHPAALDPTASILCLLRLYATSTAKFQPPQARPWTGALSQDTCSSCTRVVAIKAADLTYTCGACGVPVYCSPQCLAAHWDAHSWDCCCAITARVLDGPPWTSECEEEAAAFVLLKVLGSITELDGVHRVGVLAGGRALARLFVSLDQWEGGEGRREVTQQQREGELRVAVALLRLCLHPSLNTSLQATTPTSTPPPDPMDITIDLAAALRQQGTQGSVREAIALLQSVLLKKRTDLGDGASRDASFLRLMDNLAGLAQSTSDDKDKQLVVRLYREALEATEGDTGHTGWAKWTLCLAGLLTHLGELGEAEAIFPGLLEVLNRVHGPIGTMTLAAARNFAALQLKQGKLAEAEELLTNILGVTQRRDPELGEIAVVLVHVLTKKLEDGGVSTAGRKVLRERILWLTRAYTLSQEPLHEQG